MGARNASGARDTTMSDRAKRAFNGAADAAVLAHPIFDAVRPGLALLASEPGWPDAARLTRLADQLGTAPRTESGIAVRFVAPAGGARAPYELRVFATGCVETRPDNWHDLFNALAWLAFPRTKARINALHAAEIARENGRRGRLRDMLTILDEGGALVACGDPQLADMVREFRWRELFWEQRARVLADMRFVVLGHAVLEKALEPWPGIACKVLFVDVGRALMRASVAELVAALDAHCAQWLAAQAGGGSPRALAPLPVFGYPGWLPESSRSTFYDDARYFRPLRRKAGSD
jgi:Protein of unknown function (DUF3025)